MPRRRRDRKPFLVFLLLAFLAIVGTGVYFAYSLYAPYGHYGPNGLFVEIPKGTSVRGISRLLADNGVIRNRWAFELLARKHETTRLQAGEYFFNHPVKATEVFDDIAQGRVFTISITVPEGFNTMQIAALLDQNGLVSRDAFLAATKDSTPIRDLAPNAPSVEGFLFPSTYQFPHHVTPQQVIATMTGHFREEWNALLTADPPPTNLTPRQVVTLASLVESETPKPSERPIVARVFLNRMKIGLPMQCDPTVIYALELAGKYTPPLTGRDLAFDSPYNTYHHFGLPPGPIANPGEASLRAALAPADVDYLYFVADTEGGHLFSRTLEEHNRNVTRYRQLTGQPVGKSPAKPPAKPQAPARRHKSS
jgi:UPF0755 protein